MLRSFFRARRGGGTRVPAAAAFPPDSAAAFPSDSGYFLMGRGRFLAEGGVHICPPPQLSPPDFAVSAVSAVSAVIGSEALGRMQSRCCFLLFSCFFFFFFSRRFRSLLSLPLFPLPSFSPAVSAPLFFLPPFPLPSFSPAVSAPLFSVAAVGGDCSRHRRRRRLAFSNA